MALVVRVRAFFSRVAKYPAAVLRSFERDRRRFISPGVAFLFLLIMGYGTYGFADADHSRGDLVRAQHALANSQRVFVGNSYSGCRRTNATNGAVLDLGQLVALLRGTSSGNALVQEATRDLIAMSRRGSKDPMLARALKDIGLVLGGSVTGKPDPKSLQRARHVQAVEDDFIAKASKIEKPRPCARIYNVKKVPQ